MIYYEYSRPCDARSIAFLDVEGCLVFFGACFGAENKGVLGLFLGKAAVLAIARLLICYSVWSRLPTLILNVADGGVFP